MNIVLIASVPYLVSSPNVMKMRSEESPVLDQIFNFGPSFQRTIAAIPLMRRVSNLNGSNRENYRESTQRAKVSNASSESVQVWYTCCPVIHACNVEGELGWIEEEFKKLGAKFDYFRSVRENNFYPDYIHNLDNLFRFGGCAPGNITR